MLVNLDQVKDIIQTISAHRATVTDAMEHTGSSQSQLSRH